MQCICSQCLDHRYDCNVFFSRLTSLLDTKDKPLKLLHRLKFCCKVDSLVRYFYYPVTKPHVVNSPLHPHDKCKQARKAPYLLPLLPMNSLYGPNAPNGLSFLKHVSDARFCCKGEDVSDETIKAANPLDVVRSKAMTDCMPPNLKKVILLYLSYLKVRLEIVVGNSRNSTVTALRYWRVKTLKKRIKAVYNKASDAFSRR